jgi:hypothetical protein
MVWGVSARLYADSGKVRGVADMPRASGAQGGVRLVRDSRDISLGDVIRTPDDQPRAKYSSTQGRNCALLPRCWIKGMLARAEQGFLKELDRFDLPDCLTKLVSSSPRSATPKRLPLRLRGSLTSCSSNTHSRYRNRRQRRCRWEGGEAHVLLSMRADVPIG